MSGLYLEVDDDDDDDKRTKDMDLQRKEINYVCQLWIYIFAYCM
jgi:hypothetical protein